jgi:hypothetical protein
MSRQAQDMHSKRVGERVCPQQRRAPDRRRRPSSAHRRP